MHLSKSTKILLGLATLWPFIYMIIFFAFILSMFIWASKSSEETGFAVAFGVLMVVHILTMLWIIGLTIIYMVDVFKNDRVEKDYKVLWAVVIFMGSVIAMPIYWYLYLWREPPAAELTGHATT